MGNSIKFKKNKTSQINKHLCFHGDMMHSWVWELRAAKPVVLKCPHCSHHCAQGTSTSPLALVALGPPEDLPGLPGAQHTAMALQELPASLEGMSWWERLFSSLCFSPTAKAGQDQPPGAPVRAPPGWAGCDGLT